MTLFYACMEFYANTLSPEGFFLDKIVRYEAVDLLI